jgi:hypothetical protein
MTALVFCPGATLATLGRQVSDALHMRFDVIERKRRVMPNRAGRMIVQPQPLFGTPRVSGPYRTRCEAATAGGTDIVEDRFHALHAVGAFISANARIGGVRGQVTVAEFAVRT